MRGCQNFNLFFLETPELKALPRIGRDADLVASRNELLLHRYYWHGSRDIEPGVRMNYDSIISTLSKEFFLSPRRIADLVQTNAEKIKQLRNEYKQLSSEALSRKLARKWAWLQW